MAEHVGSQAVVGVEGTGLVLHREGKELLHPIGVRLLRTVPVGSVSCPQFMVSRSRTVMAARFSLTVAGSFVGKEGDDLVRQLQPAFRRQQVPAVAVNVLLTGSDVRLILFPFAHPFFGNDILPCCIIMILCRSCPAFFTASRYLFMALSSFGVAAARGRPLVSWLMEISFMPLSSMAFRTQGACQQVGHSPGGPAPRPHIRCGRRFHFIVVQCRVV